MRLAGLTGGWQTATMPPRKDALLFSPILLPRLHGAVGVLDELLLFIAPLAVVIIILISASRRARRNAPPRKRAAQSRDETLPPSQHQP
jgi:hypothetical protein